MFPVTFATLSRQGDRDYNEDSVGVESADQKWCFVLADGLGGHGKGEVASGIAVTTSKTCFGAGKENLADWFEEAQKSISEVQVRLHAESQMKTTMAAAELTPEFLSWGHIGDSRIYYFRKNRLVKRTMDHSVPQMLVNMGQIKEKDIRFHEDRNRLLRVMGTEWRGERPYELEQMAVPKGEQALLLCSDGFWELIDEERMTECLKQADSPENWLERMERIVCENGKEVDMDNYSAIAVWFGEKSRFPFF